MKAAIISLGSTSSKWTATAMRKYFKTVDELDLRLIEIDLGKKDNVIMYDGKPLKKYDCIYAKGSFRYNHLLRSITTLAPKNTFMPIKASAFTEVHNKLLTHIKLEANGISMPTTYISATSDAAKKLLERINYPIVMKFPEGTQGKGVMFADSFSSASSVLDALTSLRQPFIIQEYIDTNGTDTRVFVVGDTVVAAMQRKAVKGEQRSNIHAGGIGEPITVDDDTKQVAIKAARAMGVDICGVDVLDGIKGPQVIELNLSPGLQGITEASGVDVADVIAKYLYEKTKPLVEGRQKKETSKILEDIQLESKSDEKELFANLDIRAGKIVLPPIVSKLGTMKEGDEVSIKLANGTITISKV